MSNFNEPKVIKDIKLNKETIRNFDLRAVELIDINNVHYQGYFIVKNERAVCKYLLLPFNNYFTSYAFSLGHIKSIKHLTNGVELKK